MNINVNDTITISEYVTKSPLHFSTSDSITIEEVVAVRWWNTVWSNRNLLTVDIWLEQARPIK